jgi:hypothetical protein
MPRLSRLIGVALVCAVAAAPGGGAQAVAAGSRETSARAVVPALARARVPSDRIPSRVVARTAVHLRVSMSRRIAVGARARLFVAPSLDGKLVCLVASSRGGEVATACSPPATFTEQAGFVVLIGDTGPGTAPTRVLAAANSRVRALVLAFESSRRQVTPNADGGVVYAPGTAAGRLLSISSVDAAGATIATLRVPNG